LDQTVFSVSAGVLDMPDQAIIDGEVVVVYEGRTNFSELQADLAADKQHRPIYYAFDLLNMPRSSTSRVSFPSELMRRTDRSAPRPG
jgi:ATP-dependent DNA ligase